MLVLNNVTIARGAKVLIENLDLAIFEKNVIGIVGSNGSGKTSLFTAIQGKLEPKDGEITVGKQIHMAVLEQEVPALDISALDYALSGDEVLFGLLERLKKAEATDDCEAMVECHGQLHELNGYGAQAKAAKILTGLGFSQAQLDQPVRSFSGGWRMRLNLAKCLFADSDLLLLDEPTNHLDMEAIVWLENHLKHYQGAVLMVSHDQDFLDNTVSHILHVENQTAKLYVGDYSSFERQRAEHIIQQNARYKKQQAQVAHQMKFVERFRYKATKAKQAQSRLKSIEKMELVKPIYESSPFEFRFKQPQRMPNPMLTMRGIDFGYDDHLVLCQVYLQLLPGDRIGLLGVNGAGKSTLIKGICGELAPLAGVVKHPASLAIGYFAQHQVDHLPLDRTALALLQEIAPNRQEGDLLAYLGSFAFGRDQAMSPLSQFSGGEKARVALALMIWQRPNLLLLDEPTNHLDLEMRQALSFALQSYEGAMILVSHDRHLLRTLVDDLYLIEGGFLDRYDGTVQNYLDDSER